MNVDVSYWMFRWTIERGIFLSIDEHFYLHYISIGEGDIWSKARPPGTSDEDKRGRRSQPGLPKLEAA